MKKLLILGFCCLAVACSEEDPDVKRKREAQAALEAWAEKREKFVKEHCQDPKTDCRKLMREAGLDKEGKNLY